MNSDGTDPLHRDRLRHRLRVLGRTAVIHHTEVARAIAHLSNMDDTSYNYGWLCAFVAHWLEELEQAAGETTSSELQLRAAMCSADNEVE